MSLGPAAVSAAINAITALIGFISAHTGAPGTTGASEYAGVTRQAVTWTASSAGSNGANSNALAFTTSGATPVTDFGGWTAVTAGVFESSFHAPSSVTATNISVAIGALTLAAV